MAASDYTLVSSVCLKRSCTLVYRSADGLIGLVIRSGGRQRGQRYFLWQRPDSAPEYRTEQEARSALAAGQRRPPTRRPLRQEDTP
jgi:hypothetical protein